jgi:hypothetical protein
VKEGLVSGAKAVGDVLPDFVKSGASAVGNAYNQFSSSFPEATQDIKDVLYVATAVPIGKTAKYGADLTGDALTLAKIKSPAKIDRLIDEAIDFGIKKGIKPSIIGKRNSGMVDQYYNNARTAVKDIVETSPVDKLPRSLEDFSNTVRETKRQLYDQYHGMALAAGEEGAMVELAPIRNELQAIIDGKNILGDTKAAAQRLLENISSYDAKITPSVAEDLIASFNSKTKGFFKNPDFHSAGDALLTERTAKNLRRSVDDTIEGYQGPGYQDLKKRYGAQTAIEKEVTDRATVDARKNLKGFFDLTDVVTSQEFIYGLATMNPAHIAAAAAGKSVKNYIKHVNDPNRIITDMFSTVGKLQAVKNNAPSMKTGLGQKAYDSLYGTKPVPDPSGVRPPPLALPMPERGTVLSSQYTPPLNADPGLMSKADEMIFSRTRPPMALPPGSAPQLALPDVPDLMGTIARERAAGPKMFQGNTPQVPLSEWNPELSNRLDEFLRRGSTGIMSE